MNIFHGIVVIIHLTDYRLYNTVVSLKKNYIYMMYIFTVESQAFHVWTPTGFASFMASELSRLGKSGLSRSLLE